MLAIGNNHLELIMAGVGDDPTVSVARQVVDRIVRHIHVSVEGVANWYITISKKKSCSLCEYT